MKRLFPLLLLILSACRGEPTTNETSDAIAGASLATMERLTDELKTVKDRESWLKAQNRIESLSDEMRDLREKGNGLLKLTTKARDSMEDKYRSRIHEATESLKSELERITNTVESGKDYVKKIDHLMKGKLEETKKS